MNGLKDVAAPLLVMMDHANTIDCLAWASGDLGVTFFCYLI